MAQKWKQVENTKDPDQILIEKLGPRYEEYRQKWNSASRLEKVYDYPVHLDFELNFGCNLRCPQCILQVNPSEFPKGHPYHINTKKQKISFEKFREIIDEGLRYGLCSITLGVNNEPLMNRQIVKFIDYARQKGVIDIIIITNATLLSEELSKELLDSGLTKLYFSVDSIKEETYKIIRKGGDLKQAMENINNFLRLKKERGALLPITRVSFVKSKVNSIEADEFIKYWEGRVDFVCIQAFVTPSECSSYKETKEMFQIENSDLKELGPCPQPYQRLTIYHDGSVHPCCHLSGATLIIGNIYSGSIYDMWNSPKMKQLRKDINNLNNLPQECRICRKVVFGKDE